VARHEAPDNVPSGEVARPSSLETSQDHDEKEDGDEEKTIFMLHPTVFNIDQVEASTWTTAGLATRSSRQSG